MLSNLLPVYMRGVRVGGGCTRARVFLRVFFGFLVGAHVREEALVRGRVRPSVLE